MRLKKFALQLFEEAEVERIVIDVPEGSKLLKAIVLPEGIFAIYQVPQLDMETASFQRQTFTIVNKDGIIPDGFECVDILSCDVQDVDGQGRNGLVVFPLFIKN
jgi:hypothetical protein